MQNDMKIGDPLNSNESRYYTGLERPSLLLTKTDDGDILIQFGKSVKRSF